MPHPSIPNFAQSMQILRQTPGVLRGLLSLATPEQMNWQPAPDRFSIAMVLAHLADVEARGFQSRFKALLAADDPVLPAYDQLDLFETGAQFDPFAEMVLFEERRVETLALLESMPDDAGNRSGRHEELGTLTIAQLINEFAFHDLGHIRQALELYRSCVFYPGMGVYRDYYKINP